MPHFTVSLQHLFNSYIFSISLFCYHIWRLRPLQRARFISEMMLQSNSVEPRKISERVAAAGQWEEPITGHYHFLEHHNTQHSSQKQFPLFPFPPNPSHSDDIVPLCTRQEAHAYKFNTTSLLCMTAIFFLLTRYFLSAASFLFSSKFGKTSFYCPWCLAAKLASEKNS